MLPRVHLFNRTSFFAVLFLACWNGFLPDISFADEIPSEIRLDGVVLDDNHPSETFAILNGEPVKNGDFVGKYQVKSIAEGEVRVIHAVTGAEEIIVPSAVKPEAVKVEEPASSLKSETTKQPPAAQGGLAELQDKIGQLWKDYNPAALTNRAWETKGMLDAARVYNAAVQHYNAKLKLAKNLDELIDAGFLDKAYRDPRQAKYGLYLDPPNIGFGVHADPLDENSGLKSIFIGQDGILRTSDKAPANIKSEARKF